MITLYSKPGCPRCSALKVKLNQLNIKFTLVEDIDKTTQFGIEHGFKTAPLLQVNNEVYDFVTAIKLIKEGAIA